MIGSNPIEVKVGRHMFVRILWKRLADVDCSLVTNGLENAMKFLPLGLVLVVLTIMTASRENPDPASGTSMLLIANKGEQTLGLVDPQAEKQVATVAESGITGHEVIASP